MLIKQTKLSILGDHLDNYFLTKHCHLISVPRFYYEGAVALVTHCFRCHGLMWAYINNSILFSLRKEANYNTRYNLDESLTHGKEKS